MNAAKSAINKAMGYDSNETSAEDGTRHQHPTTTSSAGDTTGTTGTGTTATSNTTASNTSGGQFSDLEAPATSGRETIHDATTISNTSGGGQSFGTGTTGSNTSFGQGTDNFTTGSTTSGRQGTDNFTTGSTTSGRQGTDDFTTGSNTSGRQGTDTTTTGPSTTDSNTTDTTSTSGSGHKSHLPHLHKHHEDSSNNPSDGPNPSDKQTPDQGPDPALVGDTGKSSKLTGSGVDGSHSAVFGLTPDGHKHTDTHHGVTPVKPAHSSETAVSGKNEDRDTGSRAPAGEGVAEQMNQADTGKKGLERTDPVSSSGGSDGKPGAGFTGAEQGSGTVGN